MENTIKGIFLDIGWTMNAPASYHWLLPIKFEEIVGIDRFLGLGEQKIESAMEKGIQFLDDNHLIKTTQEEYEQFIDFYELLNRELSELLLSRKDVEQIAHDKVYNDENFLFYGDVHPALKALQQKYALGIISDTWPSVRRVLTNAGVIGYFSSITFSCELGVFKPHQDMYLHALRGLSLPPEQTVFVDDSVENLLGAKEHGINPILIVRREMPAGGEKLPHIHSLLELDDAIKTHYS